ncbi:MAG: phage holin family protein [Actinobacteria bacterium]|nr:phage holin family protein [Actinomycetota bacterium]
MRRRSREVPQVAATDSETQRDGLHEQPIGELLKQLATETTTLVRQELELAKAEMREKGKQAGPGVGLIGAAGGVALLAAGALTAFLILALDGVMPNWLAALLVALAYGVAAGVLYSRGKEKVDDVGSPAPRQTIETVKEDVQWAKHPTTSVKR